MEIVVCQKTATVYKQYINAYVHTYVNTGLYTFNAGPCVSIQLPARLTVAAVVPGPQS